MITDGYSSEGAKILVAEDEGAARDLIGSIFEVGGLPKPFFASDGLGALDLLQNGDFDVLITDLDMPKLSGEALIPKALDHDPDLTVVVMTGFGTIERAVDLMKQGVFDFICKPFELDRVIVGVERACERAHNVSEVRGIREVIQALLAALESKDEYLNGHSSRVAQFAVELGKAAGICRRDLRFLEYSALLHDVGKIGVHEDVLNKPGKLTDEEFEIIKQHPVWSHEIVAPVDFLAPCLPAILHHHERMDGRGYPHGISGDEIPYGARIISIVDAFDAMTSNRSYRNAMPIEKSLKIIRESAGTQFDSDLCDLFLENFHEITAIDSEVPEHHEQG